MKKIIKTLTTAVLVVGICLSSTVNIITNQTALANDNMVEVQIQEDVPERRGLPPQNKSVFKKRIIKIVSYKRYVKKTVKVHLQPSAKSKTIKKLNKGDRYKIVAVCENWCKIGKNKWVHKSFLSKKDPIKRFQGVALQYSEPYNVTKHKLTMRIGEIRYNGHRETYYSQRVLPGRGLNIPGRHVAKDGTIRDKEGYICVAANPNYMSYKSKVMTSLGPAKVYDSGCDYGTIDIYIDVLR